MVTDPWDEPDAEYPDLRCYLWSQLAKRLREGDPKAMEELYSMFANGVRFYLAKQVPADDIDDKLHDAFLIVVDAIRDGDLRDPRRLMGFIRTVVKRTITSSIGQQVTERKGKLEEERSEAVCDESGSPEATLLEQQQVAILKEVLTELPRRDRYILNRFYVDEVPAQTICEEMGLTLTQFRLLKSRAKNRFGDLGKKKLQKGNFSPVLMRISRP